MRTPLNSIGDCLPDLIVSTSDIAHLKDVRTQKYIQCNFHCAQYMGFESVSSIEGLPVSELASIWQPTSDVDDFYFNRWRKWRVELNKKIEYQAYATQRPASIQSISITSTGWIQIDRMTRLPVLSPDNKKVIAILNLGRNLTSQYDLFSILNLYRRFYPDQQAIRLFLRFLKIESFFLRPPNLTEVRLLLAMRPDTQRKHVARLLNISPGTVEHYVSNLYDNLTEADLHPVLTQLRAMPCGTEPWIDDNEQNQPGAG